MSFIPLCERMGESGRDARHQDKDNSLKLCELCISKCAKNWSFCVDVLYLVEYWREIQIQLKFERQKQ